MKWGVIVFPGSNCEHDCAHVLKDVLEQDVRLIWHGETSLGGVDAVILPGGFSYGDYLRAGAIAQLSPIMEAVKTFARKGGLVLGICNGFQILLEAKLLPGALLPNISLAFICEDVWVKVENADTPYTRHYESEQVLCFPIAHTEGNYHTDPVTLAALQANTQIIFRYCRADGTVTEQANPNGSLDNIAGISNAAGNILGLMPHPERCAEAVLGNQEGQLLFRSMIDAVMSEQNKHPTIP